MHRAVRNRKLQAAIALIDGGANPLLTKRTGFPALHLAVQSTGKSGSGSDWAKTAQRRIINVLREHGASATDIDAVLVVEQSIELPSRGFVAGIGDPL